MTDKRLMRLAVDIDGVLANLVADFVPLMNRRFGCNLTPDDITQYAFEAVAGVPTAEMDDFIRSLISTGFYGGLTPVHGAADALRALRPQAHIHLITSRPAELEAETRDWLHRHTIPYDALTFRRRPHKLRAEDRADVVIEDDLEAALTAATLAPRVFLLDYPYNRCAVPLPEACVRVRGWDEVLAYLNAVPT